MAWIRTPVQCLDCGLSHLQHLVVRVLVVMRFARSCSSYLPHRGKHLSWFGVRGQDLARREGGWRREPHAQCAGGPGLRAALPRVN
jgi:hypothetical protein